MLIPYRIILIVLLCLTITTQAQQPLEEVNRFGVVEGFWFPATTCTLGVGWERIIFDWSQHQPEKSDDWYTLNVDDRWLKAADACNREVVALLKNTPAWATDGTPGVGIPRGLDLPINDPDNLWANFVRRSVDYYASRGVTRFIIWNEPDIDSETYGYEFEGDLENYFQLLRVAYLTAKATNPAVKIHLAGTTYWHDVNEGRDPYMTRLVERILADADAAENNYYFDVLSLHIYFRTETVYDIVDEMRQMLDSNGLTDKAIWINETNAAPTDDPVWPVNRPVFQLDLQDQSAFLVQSAALALAAGTERIAAYKLYDQELPPGAESFGILSPPDASPRQAFATWQMVATHFSDVAAAQLVREEPVEGVLLTHRNDQQTLVVWAREADGANIHISATSSKAQSIALTGDEAILRPSEGVYTLSLAGAQCEDGEGCFLGGVPAIIVQPAGDISVEVIDNGATISTLNFD